MPEEALEHRLGQDTQGRVFFFGVFLGVKNLLPNVPVLRVPLNRLVRLVLGGAVVVGENAASEEGEEAEEARDEV